MNENNYLNGDPTKLNKDLYNFDSITKQKGAYSNYINSLKTPYENDPNQAILNFDKSANKINTDTAQSVASTTNRLLKDGKDAKLGTKFAGAGLTALGELPSLINNFSSKAESKEEATGKVISTAASGAKIGSAFGPWGMAAGAVAGLGAGLIGNQGWKQALRDKKDKEFIEKSDKTDKDLINNYITKNSYEQIKSQKDLFASSLGYSRT